MKKYLENQGNTVAANAKQAKQYWYENFFNYLLANTALAIM